MTGTSKTNTKPKSENPRSLCYTFFAIILLSLLLCLTIMPIASTYNGHMNEQEIFDRYVLSFHLFMYGFLFPALVLSHDPKENMARLEKMKTDIQTVITNSEKYVQTEIETTYVAED